MTQSALDTTANSKPEAVDSVAEVGAEAAGKIASDIDNHGGADLHKTTTEDTENFTRENFGEAEIDFGDAQNSPERDGDNAAPDAVSEEEARDAEAHMSDGRGNTERPGESGESNSNEIDEMAKEGHASNTMEKDNRRGEADTSAEDKAESGMTEQEGMMDSHDFTPEMLGDQAQGAEPKSGDMENNKDALPRLKPDGESAAGDSDKSYPNTGKGAFGEANDGTVDTQVDGSSSEAPEATQENMTPGDDTDSKPTEQGADKDPYLYQKPFEPKDLDGMNTDDLLQKGPHTPLEGDPKDFIQKMPHEMAPEGNHSEVPQQEEGKDGGDLVFPPIHRYDPEKEPVN